MTKIEPFALERYFDKYEFTARHLLSCSDCEPLDMKTLIELADPESRMLWEGLSLGYTESKGHPKLREAIADMYSGIEAENILVAAPEECIYLFMHALLEPGDRVVYQSPAYQSHFSVARAIGCHVSKWEPDEDAGWRYDIDRLEDLTNVKLLVVNVPHNPTGYVLPETDYRTLIQRARERGVVVFSDEIFRFLEFPPTRTLPSACEFDDTAVSFGGVSKAFGLPGLRIGWVATHNETLLERMRTLKDYTTICSSAPSEILALMAIRSREQIFAQQRARLLKNLTVLDEFFENHSDSFAWNRPLGSSICFPRLRTIESASALCESLVKDAGIMLAHSGLFGFGDRHVRIGFGREDLPEVFELFEEYLDRR